jgi:predicted ATPase
MIPSGPTRFQLGSLSIDLNAHTAGVELLSEQECAILACLAARDQSITTKEDLYREVWGYRALPKGRALDFAIRRLRDKIEQHPAHPIHLKTERGRGYRLNWTPALSPMLHSTVFSVPKPMTPWIGSRETIETLSALIAQNTRLICLHGPPGVGKSRLVIEALAGTDKARFIRLSSEASTQTLMTSLSTALGTSDLPIKADLVDLCKALVVALADVDTTRLLVIDGAQEHTPLLRQLSAMLVADTQLQIIITSQVRLSIPEETVFSVNTLSLDDAEAYLIARAKTVGQDLESSPGLRQLAAALDCLPLAIELAAPRLRTLTPQELISRMQGDSQILTNPVSGLSLDHLVSDALNRRPSSQRMALGLLAQFPHGLPFEIAEQLLGSFGDPLTLLTALLDHSLIYRTTPTQGAPRFRATSTVARMLHARKQEDLPREAIHCAVAQFALDWAKPKAEACIHMPGYSKLRRELRAEQDNARAWFMALQKDNHKPEATELALSFAHLMAWAGRKRDALDLLLYCRAQATEDTSICRLLSLAAELGAKMQDTTTVDLLLAEIDDHAQPGSWSQSRGALATLTVAIARGKLAEAHRILQTIHNDPPNDPRLRVRTDQQEHKLLAMQGKTDAAAAMLDSFYKHANTADDNLGRIAHLVAVGYHAFSAGAADQAMVAYRRAIPLAAHLGHQELEAGLYRRLSLAQTADGDTQAARHSRLKALGMTDPDRHPDAQAQLLATEAEYLHAHGKPIAAADMARAAVDLSRRGSEHNTTLTSLRLAVVTGLEHPQPYPFFDFLEELETRSVSREAEINNLVTVSFVRGMLALNDNKLSRALAHAKRGYTAIEPTIGHLDTVYLIGQLATLAACAGDTALAKSWLDAAEKAYTGESWSTVLSEDPWFVRARSAIKDTT